jgi:hypothetical protein
MDDTVQQGMGRRTALDGQPALIVHYANGNALLSNATWVSEKCRIWQCYTIATL